MIYLLLMYEFFKVGLFSIGGGYATLPFLFHLSEVYGWYSVKELVDMIAVSSITPGPVGINVATFAGFKTAGLLGAVLSTLSEILPSFIIVVLVYKVLDKFSENFYIQAVLYALRPAGCALIAGVGFGLFKDYLLRENNTFIGHNLLANIDLSALFLLCGLLILSIKVKKDPLVYLGLAAILGVVIKLF